MPPGTRPTAQSTGYTRHVIDRPPARAYCGGMTPTADIVELENTLQNGGVHEALRWLDSRTPHRFTGV